MHLTSSVLSPEQVLVQLALVPVRRYLTRHKANICRLECDLSHIIVIVLIQRALFLKYLCNFVNGTCIFMKDNTDSTITIFYIYVLLVEDCNGASFITDATHKLKIPLDRVAFSGR